MPIYVVRLEAKEGKERELKEFLEEENETYLNNRGVFYIMVDLLDDFLDPLIKGWSRLSFVESCEALDVEMHFPNIPQCFNCETKTRPLNKIKIKLLGVEGKPQREVYSCEDCAEWRKQFEEENYLAEGAYSSSARRSLE